MIYFSQFSFPMKNYTTIIRTINKTKCSMYRTYVCVDRTLEQIFVSNYLIYLYKFAMIYLYKVANSNYITYNK